MTTLRKPDEVALRDVVCDLVREDRLLGWNVRHDAHDLLRLEVRCYLSAEDLARLAAAATYLPAGDGA